jgi:hypothetical protein
VGPLRRLLLQREAGRLPRGAAGHRAAGPPLLPFHAPVSGRAGAVLHVRHARGGRPRRECPGRVARHQAGGQCRRRRARWHDHASPCRGSRSSQRLRARGRSAVPAHVRRREAGGGPARHHEPRRVAGCRSRHEVSGLGLAEFLRGFRGRTARRVHGRGRWRVDDAAAGADVRRRSADGRRYRPPLCDGDEVGRQCDPRRLWRGGLARTASTVARQPARGDGDHPAAAQQFGQGRACPSDPADVERGARLYRSNHAGITAPAPTAQRIGVPGAIQAIPVGHDRGPPAPSWVFS